MSSGSIASFYSDNEIAIRDFISEIRDEGNQQYSAWLQFDLWRRFQLQAMKALLLKRNYFESVKRLLKVFLYFTL